MDLSGVRITADVWLPVDTATQLFGALGGPSSSSSSSLVSFAGGGQLLVPAQPVHNSRGVLYTALASNTSALTTLAERLLAAATAGGAPPTSADMVWLLPDRHGPFNAMQLQHLEYPELLVQHIPSRTWLPAWLAAAAAHAAAPLLLAPPQAQHQSAASSSSNNYHHQQQQQHASPGDAALSAVALLRHDPIFAEEISRAADMDWEVEDQIPPPLQLQQQQQCEAAGAAVVAAGPLPPLLLVLDTNVLLEPAGLQLLGSLELLQSRGGGKDIATVQVVLPWVVLMELDKLKSRAPASSVAAAARTALRHLQAEAVPGAGGAALYVLQSLADFRDACHVHGGGLPNRAVVADDRVLQCALQQQARQQGHHHHQQQQCVGDARMQQALPDARPLLLLLSNDTVLRLKALANSVPAAALSDISGVSDDSVKTSDSDAAGKCEKERVLLSTLCRIAARQQRTPAAAASPTALDPAEVHSSPVVPGQASAAFAAAAGDLQSLGSAAIAAPSLKQDVAPQDCDDDDAADATAARALSATCAALTPRVTEIFKIEFEDLWLHVVASPPPWSDAELLYVINKHWRNTFVEHLVPEQCTRAGAAAQYLMQVARRIRRGEPAAPCGERRPALAVGLRCEQLLRAFALDEAADSVALDTGLILAGAGQDMRLAKQRADVPAGEPEPAPVCKPQQQQQQQQQQQLLHHQGGGTGRSSDADVAAQQLARACAVAAAAVPAPTLQGPCLRLQQLADYAAALAGACTGQLAKWGGHPAASVPRADAAAALQAAVGPALQAALGLLHQLQLHAAQRGVGGGGEDSAAHPAVLSVGLVFARLCATLLQDCTAGEAVVAALSEHSAVFAADGLTWLWPLAVHGDGSAAAPLQALAAAQAKLVELAQP